MTRYYLPVVSNTPSPRLPLQTSERLEVVEQALREDAAAAAANKARTAYAALETAVDASLKAKEQADEMRAARMRQHSHLATAQREIQLAQEAAFLMQPSLRPYIDAALAALKLSFDEGFAAEVHANNAAALNYNARIAVYDARAALRSK